MNNRFVGGHSSQSRPLTCTTRTARYYSGICLVGLKKPWKTSAKIGSHWAEIWTGDHANTNTSARWQGCHAQGQVYCFLPSADSKQLHTSVGSRQLLCCEQVPIWIRNFAVRGTLAVNLDTCPGKAFKGITATWPDPTVWCTASKTSMLSYLYNKGTSGLSEGYQYQTKYIYMQL